MFDPIVTGLRSVGFAEEDIRYFTLHQEQDVNHGLWLEEALELCLHSEADAEAVHRGTMKSLDLRLRFWNGVHLKINAFRRGELTPLARTTAEEICTLREINRVGRRIIAESSPNLVSDLNR